jgi:hypothetical protein
LVLCSPRGLKQRELRVPAYHWSMKQTKNRLEHINEQNYAMIHKKSITYVTYYNGT